MGCWRPSRYTTGAWKYLMNLSISIVADMIRSFSGGKFFSFRKFCARLATPNRTSVCTDLSWASSSITTCREFTRNHVTIGDNGDSLTNLVCLLLKYFSRQITSRRYLVREILREILKNSTRPLFLLTSYLFTRAC